MNGVIEVIDSFITRTKDAVKVAPNVTPVLIRVYSGNTRVFTLKKDAPFTANRVTMKLWHNKCLVISHRSFDGEWSITKITMAFDHPGLNRFETPLPTLDANSWLPLICPRNGTLTLDPRSNEARCLWSLSRDSWVD